MRVTSLTAALLALTLCVAPGAAQAELVKEEPPGEAQPAQEVQAQSEGGWGKAWSMGGLGLTHGLLYTYAYFAWYRGRSLTEEIVWRDEGFFGLETYAGGADKLGHMYSNYALTRGTSQILQYGGWSKATSNTLSASLSMAFFTMIELKDGYHRGFGFSWGDMTFNALGIGLAVVMEAVPWVDENFSFRLEYIPTKLFIDQLLNNGLVDAAEDYSGQTFLLAHHLRGHEGLLNSESWSWLRYVDVVAGFGSRNYLPIPKFPKARRQEVFLGVSLNVQEVIHQIFYPERRDQRGPGYGALHFTTEIVAVPYTTLPVLHKSRALDTVLNAQGL